jgi:photosystem II stability/assembly factor-like uncharacterized protein
MRKYILISLCALALLSASCDLGGKTKAGILKTATGGVDWQSANMIKNSETGMDGFSISKLDFAPGTNDIIYASSTNAGLYKSTDGATSWEQTLGEIPVLDFAINPNDNQTIYAAGYFENRGRTLVTHDAGKSWNTIYTAAHVNSSVRSVALNPNNPQQVAIGLSEGELIMSSDGGSTWRLVQSYNDRINRIFWTNDSMYIVVRTVGVFRSIDNGTSFQLITAGLQSSGNINNLSIWGASISSFNQLAISASNRQVLYLTTNLGLYRTSNGGSSWQFVSMPLRQSDVQPTAVAISPNSENIVYVSAGSLIYKTSDGGGAWSSSDSLTGNLINALLVDPSLPQVAYAGVYKQ